MLNQQKKFAVTALLLVVTLITLYLFFLKPAARQINQSRLEIDDIRRQFTEIDDGNNLEIYNGILEKNQKQLSRSLDLRFSVFQYVLPEKKISFSHYKKQRGIYLDQLQKVADRKKVLLKSDIFPSPDSIKDYREKQLHYQATLQLGYQLIHFVLASSEKQDLISILQMHYSENSEEETDFLTHRFPVSFRFQCQQSFFIRFLAAISNPKRKKLFSSREIITEKNYSDIFAKNNIKLSENNDIRKLSPKSFFVNSGEKKYFISEWKKQSNVYQWTDVPFLKITKSEIIVEKNGVMLVNIDLEAFGLDLTAVGKSKVPSNKEEEKSNNGKYQQNWDPH